MIARLFDRGVVLRMGAREIRATSTHRLRSDLTGHATLRASRIAELGKLPDRALAAQALAVAALTASLGEALARRDCDPAMVLAQIHAAKAPIDAVWTNAVAQVSAWPDARAAYQRALLDALFEYLASERDCLRTLLDNRHRTPQEHVSPAGGASEPGAQQRLIFDVAQDDAPHAPPVEFNRLTKGETLDIPINTGQCVQLLLAGHRLALVCGSPWRLIDEFGEDYRLTPARCVAGRSEQCDLVIGDSFRAISRRHVIFETLGAELVRITDISSLGTSVPRAYLDNRLP